MSEQAHVPPRPGQPWPAALLFGPILLLGLAAAAPSLLNDPDTQWHVATGRLMWATGAVPQVDGFSHTFAGAPWIAKEWLAQLLVFAAYSAAGWWGVALFTAAVITVSFTLILAFLLRRAKPTVALMAVLLALALAMPAFVARPHIVVLPVTILWMQALVRARERGRAPAWWVAGLVTLWANMHASYPTGLVWAGFLAAESVVTSPPAARFGLALRWAAFLALALLAACVSPYGIKTLLIVITVAETAEITNYVSEWAPIGWGPQGLLAAASIAGALVVLARHWRENPGRIAAVALLGYMMVVHSRFALMFATLVPVLVAAPLGRAFAGLSPASIAIPRPRVLIGSVAAAALVMCGLVRPAPNPAVTPTAALRFAQEHGLKGPVYNDYDFGGFLILHGVPTFIDGRNDQLFIHGFTTRLSAALASPDNDGFAAMLARYHVAWGLVRPGSPDADHLARLPGWAKLYGDDTAAIYAPAVSMAEKGGA